MSEWIDTINSQNKKYLSDIEIVKSREYKDLLTDLSGVLAKTNIDEFKSFLADNKYSFIPDRIKEKLPLNEFYSSEYVLLTYFLIKRFRSTFQLRWALDLNKIQYIYTDLGISCSFST